MLLSFAVKEQRLRAGTPERFSSLHSLRNLGRVLAQPRFQRRTI